MQDPAHPGEVLRQHLPKGLPLGEVATRLGVTRQALSALINGRAGVSATMALRLEAALGTEASMWLGLQANYDLWEARKRPPVVAQLEGLAWNAVGKRSENTLPQLPGLVVERLEGVRRLCERHGVRELALFGSVLRVDFDAVSSDIDVAVSFGAPVGESLARQYVDFKVGLEELFGRPVDVLEFEAMPDSRLKRIIESTMVPVYAAAA